MSHRASWIVGLAIAAMALSAGKSRQIPSAAEERIVRITVALVQVDAVVTDSKGKHVTDLKAEDFEIKQDGKLQKLTHFSYVASSLQSTPAERTSKPNREDLSVLSLPPKPLQANEVKRAAALVVDDLGLSFESMEFVRQALRKFVDEQMQPGDLVAILRTGSGVGALQQFTADKRVLHAAINSLKWNFRGRVGIHSFPPTDSSMPEDEATLSTSEADFMEETFSVGTLAAVGQVVGGLGELPGRKSAIIFSENIRIFQGGSANPRIWDDLQRLTDLTNRAGVVLYTIDPRGLPTLSLTAADRTLSGSDVQEGSNARRRTYFESQEGLSYLAQQTGGLFFHDNNDIAGSIKEVMEDQTGYYLLGYTPEDGTFDQDLKNQKFHRVSVRVLRPGLQTRSRTGFLSISDSQRKPAVRSRESRVMAALMSPFAAAGIKVRLTSLFAENTKLGPYVQSLLHIDARDLTFQEQTNGSYKTVIDVLTMTSRGSGEEADTSQRSYTIEMHGETYQRALKQGFILSVNHPVKKAGFFQMRAVVSDTAGQRVGSASQFVDVPEVKKGHLVLSGVVLKGASNRTLKELQLKEQVGADDGQMQDYSEGSPAVRRFFPGQTVMYGFQVINPRRDAKTQQSHIEKQVCVFRNGKVIFTSKPALISIRDPSSPKRLIGAGVLYCSANMLPGEYVLQVTVTDKLAKPKNSKAYQWIDFEILKAPRTK